jgi:hypothetical protein
MHIFCFFILEGCFFFSLQLDSLLLVCTICTQNKTSNVKRNYNLQNSNICPRFSHYSHIFCATNERDSDSKRMMFLTKMDGYEKNV